MSPVDQLIAERLIAVPALDRIKFVNCLSMEANPVQTRETFAAQLANVVLLSVHTADCMVGSFIFTFKLGQTLCADKEILMNGDVFAKGGRCGVNSTTAETHKGRFVVTGLLLQLLCRTLSGMFGAAGYHVKLRSTAFGARERRDMIADVLKQVAFVVYLFVTIITGVGLLKRHSSLKFHKTKGFNSYRFRNVSRYMAIVKVFICKQVRTKVAAKFRFLKEKKRLRLPGKLKALKKAHTGVDPKVLP